CGARAGRRCCPTRRSSDLGEDAVGLGAAGDDLAGVVDINDAAVVAAAAAAAGGNADRSGGAEPGCDRHAAFAAAAANALRQDARSEEHTSELRHVKSSYAV